MPRIFDGPIPERPVRNALPERIQELLDRVGGAVRPDGERPGHWFGQQGTLAEHVFHDRGETGANKVPSDDAARIGPAAPAIAAPAVSDHVSVEARASEAAAALNFHADGEFTVRGEHHLSQMLTANADWFLP